MEVITAGPSGLLVAVEGADARDVGALLRRHDPELRLVPQFSEEHQCRLWVVFRYRGSDRPSEHVCYWQTREGVPLPLSSSLLDLVQTLDKTTSSRLPDSDVLNQEVRDRRAREHRGNAEAIVDEWLMPHGRPVLPRGQSLRRARDKQRNRGKKI